MSDITAFQAAELRGEIEELRGRLKELDDRLTARLRSVEDKHQNDIAGLQGQITRMSTAIETMYRRIGNIDSLARANHMATIHLWGVTASYMKVPDAEIAAAQRKAEEALNVVPRE